MSASALALAAAALAVGSGATAAPPPEPATAAALPASIDLEHLLALLRQRSPRTAAGRAELAVTATARIAAGIHPNPTLSYGGLALLAGANTGAAYQHEIALEQPLVIWGQIGLRQDVADRQLDVGRAELEATEAGRRAAARAAFAALLARQGEQELLQQSLEDLQRVEKVVQGRAEAGDRSRYDVERVGAEARLLQVEAYNAGTETGDAAGRLAGLLGFPGWAPHADGSLEPADLPTDAAALWAVAQARRPDLVAQRRRQAASAGRLALAQRERWPVPSLVGGVNLTQQQESVSAVFGLSLPLPLFDRNQGEVARVEAEIEADAAGLTADLAEARAEIERAAGVLQRRRQALANLEVEVVERLPALRQMAEDAYREGRSSILELLDASRSLTEMRLEHLRQHEAVKVAEAELIAAAGLDESPSQIEDAPAAPGG